jgi:hypothetical protein
LAIRWVVSGILGIQKAHFGLLDMPDWYAEFQNAVPRYDDELAAERALWEQFDQPGMMR